MDDGVSGNYSPSRSYRDKWTDLARASAAQGKERRFLGQRLSFLSARQTTTISATDFPWLCGHAIDAKTGITLVGEEVTTAGTWNPSKSEVLPVQRTIQHQAARGQRGNRADRLTSSRL